MATMKEFQLIDEIENVWIPLPDGRRLAARLWMPKNASLAPVPAIFEFLPYRKRDFIRTTDETHYRYYAMNGYACVRADIGGTGESEGILQDEYTRREQEDAVEIIKWISKQPWCSGDVGMTGSSWSGFNALQVATLNPPALKAVLVSYFTDDRYADDMHYMGGCLMNDNMVWGTALTTFAAYPPDPEIVGRKWERMWRQRLENLEPPPALWMNHQTRDAYWKHGSVCEDYNKIKCPVFAVGGWADGYSNAVPRLLEHLEVPCRGLIGPWGHTSPQDAAPGPSIGFMQEAVRWWDHWLKGEDTGIMKEPKYRVYMEEYAPPSPEIGDRPGHWIAQQEWHGPNIKPHAYILNPGQLGDDPLPETIQSVSSPMTTGLYGGAWCHLGVEGEKPLDQRLDDGGSLVFDTDPLGEDMEIMGAPELEFDVCADKPLAQMAARLCDVAPDGSVSRVTYTVLNLTHRDSHEKPEPLEPGKWYHVKLRFNDCANAFPAGHKIRLALSTSYWPLLWPSPEKVMLSIKTGKESSLTLPVRVASPEDQKVRFGEPEQAASSETTVLENVPQTRIIHTDLKTGVVTLKCQGESLGFGFKEQFDDTGTIMGSRLRSTYRIDQSDPLSAKVEFRQVSSMERGKWSIEIDVRTALTATNENFRFSCDLVTLKNGKPFVERHWAQDIPRHLL